MTYLLDGIESLPSSESDREVLKDADAALLAILAGTYSATHSATQQTAMDTGERLWRSTGSINDYDMTRWTDIYDRAMESHQQTQFALADTYGRNSLRSFGVSAEPIIEITDDLDDLFDDLDEFVNSEWFGQVHPRVRNSARDALAKWDTKVSRDMAALAERAKQLHTPIVTVRVETAAGATLDSAVDAAASKVRTAMFQAGRAAERRAMQNRAWPKYQNGTAMLYKRVPEAGACGWCQTVATRLYSMETFRKGSKWHDFCRCEFRLITESEAVAYGKALSRTGGTPDYWSAARRIGLWSGEAPENYSAYIRDNRAVTEEAP